MDAKKNYLIVIAAPSGAGKTTLCQRVLADFPQVLLSISSTTRPPRGAETNGVEYFFLSEEAFRETIQRGGFAEWAKVHGNYYGTSKEVIEKALSHQRSVLLDIDVQGAEQLRQSYPNDSILIFICPPSLEVLEARLRARKTDSEQTIQKRLRNAVLELAESEKFDFQIVNDDLDRAYLEIKNILEMRLGLSGSNKGK